MTETRDKIVIESTTQGVDQSTDKLKGLANAYDGVAVASEKTEKSTVSIENKFASLERRFQTTAGQQAQFEKIQTQVNLAVKQNPELQDRANSVLAAAEARYLGAGAAVKALAAAHTGLDAQGQAALHTIRSVVEQLALGIPPTQALTGQLNHLTFAATGEGGLVGAFKQVGGLIGGLITPTNAAIAGTVALAAAAAALAVQYDKVQVSSQRAISGAGQRTGTTTSDLNSFVDKNTPSAFSGATLSQKESRALGEGLTQTGDIVISKLQSMSAAVVGFSNQTGQSMDESVKAFTKLGSDPVKALDELAKAFGPFSQETRTLVQDMVASGDKTLAWNAILRELGPTAKDTAGNMTTAEMAARGLANALQTAPKPTGLEKQLEDIRQKLNGAIEAAEKWAAIGQAAPPEVSNSIAALSKQFEGLYARQQAVIGLKVSSTFDDIADKARVATEALTPEIAQIEQLKIKIGELNRAKEAGATSLAGGDADAAALVKAQNQLQALKESQAEAARYAIEVANIASSWGNVGQSVALQLQTMENALPVARAWTEAGKMRAQYEQTYLDLLNKGKTAQEATAIASKQEELTKAAAVASAQKLVQSSEDNLEKIKAQGTEMEGVVAASIAYRDAIQAGATATQAAAIAANTLQANLLQAAKAADQLAQNEYKAQVAAQTAAQAQFGDFGQQANFFSGPTSNGKQYTSTLDPLHFSDPLVANQFKLNADLITQTANTALATGGLQAALNAIKSLPDLTGNTADLRTIPGYNTEGLFGPERSIVPEKISTIDALFQSQPGDKTANSTMEIQWLKANLPASVERDAKIAELTNAISGLTTSTNSLNATNNELLSPYYTQDPRTSHIGFRSQGMASGGEFTVPGGYSSNDNMIGTIPLASGEIVSVRRPGESAGTVVHIVNNISVPAGASRATANAIGRTVYQSTQSAARQLQAVGR